MQEKVNTLEHTSSDPSKPMPLPSNSPQKKDLNTFTEIYFWLKINNLYQNQEPIPTQKVPEFSMDAPKQLL
jgi:hypothetical protein